uniref:Uncharacterized protein n=1 Tax=Globisporangium ultimum (strain ATCC 200006 / CBS 805.95 / DAOM BR144) TaxID=431595 RepID=K3WSX1_GLOUD
MKLAFSVLAAAFTLTSTATSSPSDNASEIQASSALPITNFNFSSYCNGTAFDSMHSSPSSTWCFNSKQEWVGVTDWFLTGQAVLDQFPGLNNEPNVCRVLFNSDPYPIFEWNDEYQLFTAKSKSRGGTATWTDSWVKLSNTIDAEFIKFALVGPSCIKNVMIACNNGATGGLGDVAVSLGNGYWEHLFGTLNIPFVKYGPESSGVRPLSMNDYSLHVSPWAMSGDWDMFWGSANLVVEPFGDTMINVPKENRCTSTSTLQKGPYPACQFINQ